MCIVLRGVGVFICFALFGGCRAAVVSLCKVRVFSCLLFPGSN